MDFNVLIGGAAGQGMETLSAVAEKLLLRTGYEVFTIRDLMSRIRGGHNFVQIRFGCRRMYSHKAGLDAIIALNSETVGIHSGKLTKNGFIIGDSDDNFENTGVTALPLKKTAEDAGNIRAFGSVAIGALFAMLGLDAPDADGIFKEIFKNEEIAKQNIDAFRGGIALAAKKVAAPACGPGGKMLINGNQAMALGAIAAGVRFYSAYPMSPSTGIMIYLASKMAEAGIVVEQAEDEIAAINMAIGASYAGARAMTGTSGGGFALMAEAVGLSGMLEVPLVIAEMQRPGPTTGFPTRTEQSDLRFVISAGQGEFPRMVIAIRSPEDAFYQTVRAFNLADKYRIPVVLLSDQYLADQTVSLEPFDISRVKADRHFDTSRFENGKDKSYLTYEITKNGISPRIIPGKIPGTIVRVDSDEHDESGCITESAEIRMRMSEKRFMKMKKLESELTEPEFLGDNAFETLILAWGSTYGPVREAVETLNDEGGKYAALIFVDIWPLPAGLLTEKSLQAKHIINVEQNATGQLAGIVKECTGIQCGNSILKYDGRQISAEEICARIKGQKGAGS